MAGAPGSGPILSRLRPAKKPGRLGSRPGWVLGGLGDRSAVLGVRSRGSGILVRAWCQISNGLGERARCLNGLGTGSVSDHDTAGAFFPRDVLRPTAALALLRVNAVDR